MTNHESSQPRVIRFGSLFAGIGGFDLGLERAGMACDFSVECDAKCNSVVKRHWPEREQFDDVRTFTLRSTDRRPDLICGGFPCQDLSVAGRRAGLAGERSGLFHEAARIIAEFAPAWVLIENVPGLLSSAGGRDMGTVLGRLAELGYGTAYRILDSQWLGVPQRRRRVFIVGCLGDWRRAAEVLFEPESLPWDSPPRREAGAGASEGPAGCLNSGGNSGGFRSEPGEHLVTHALTGEGHDASEDVTGRGTPIVAIQDARDIHKEQNGRGWNDDGSAYTLDGVATHAVAYQCHGSNVGPMGHLRKGNGNETGGVPFVFQPRIGRNGRGQPDELCPTLQGASAGETSDMRPVLQYRMAVRRLTPRECERLQAFPDDFTRYGHDGKEISDSARYRMLGNAVTVNVIEWIGKRIADAARR